jgi:uncharacterized protein (DUF952 family)
MIYHITTRTDWQAQQSVEHFTAPSLSTEGFIHCSTAGQYRGVRQRYFAGQTDLVLLHIDEVQLEPLLKFEVSTGGEEFPHVYGPINKGAIVKVERLL